MEKTKRIFLVLVIISILIVAGVFYFFASSDKDELFIATTTSVENSGLLDFLLDIFEDLTDIDVKVTAVGSGAAVDLARRGEVDALLVHAPDLEKEFVSDGFGINYTTLWFNFFVVLGPQNDPAAISSATNVTQAFQRIYDAGQAGAIEFFSRGDNSGTHIKELEIWAAANISVSAETLTWYKETGAGMSSTITTANQFDGYVLTDLGTFVQLAFSDTASIKLIELFTGDQILYNPYSYMIVNPEKYGNLNTDAALRFLEFLIAEETQELVRNYKVNDVTLFTPVP